MGDFLRLHFLWMSESQINRCLPTQTLAHFIADHPSSSAPFPTLPPTLQFINPSGNITPTCYPPPSSRHGPASSKTKHPKSWAAPLSTKRPREAASRYQEGTTTVTFS